MTNPFGRLLGRCLPIIGVVLASVPVAAQSRSAGGDAVAAAWRTFVQTVRNNDAAGMASWWTDDAIWMGLGAPTTNGRPAFESMVRGVFSTMRITEFTDQIDEITVTGNVAVQRGTYAETVQPQSGPASTMRHRYILVWRREPKAGWKIARGIATDLPEPTAGP